MDWLINSMEPSPSQQANTHSSTLEFPITLWNVKVQYCVQKSLPLVPILTQYYPPIYI
jgi:hypothetical protein